MPAVKFGYGLIGIVPGDTASLLLFAGIRFCLAGCLLLAYSLVTGSSIALTPGRMGQAHAANAVGFQVAAAVLGGTALVSGFGQIADRLGLEAFGPYLLVAALLLSGVFLILEHAPRRPAADR